MSRRATIKRAKIRRDDDLSRFCLFHGITKRQARRHRKWLEEEMNASMLDLMNSSGPIRYSEPWVPVIVECLAGHLDPPRIIIEAMEGNRVGIMIEVMEENQMEQSIQYDITV